MKKTILALLLLSGLASGVSAQPLIHLKTDNNTTQYFTSSILDIDTWDGSTPPMYMDLPNNMTTVHYAITNTGGGLSSVTKWCGVQLRAYPSGIYYQTAYFTTVPYAAPLIPYGPGMPIHIFCDIISASDLYVRIDP